MSTMFLEDANIYNIQQSSSSKYNKTSFALVSNTTNKQTHNRFKNRFRNGVTKMGFHFLPETTELGTKYVKRWLWLAHGQRFLRHRRQSDPYHCPSICLERISTLRSRKGNPGGASRLSELKKPNWDLRTRWLDLWDRKSRSREPCKENMWLLSVSPEYSTECHPVYVCNYTAKGPGNNHLKRLEETVQNSHTRLGIIFSPTK